MKKLSPLKSIKARCYDCGGFSHTEVKTCNRNECELYTLRLGKRVKGEQPLKNIRKYCLWCMKNSSPEIVLCPSTDCVFYLYRFGSKTDSRVVSHKKGIDGSIGSGD